MSTPSQRVGVLLNAQQTTELLHVEFAHLENIINRHPDLRACTLAAVTDLVDTLEQYAATAPGPDRSSLTLAPVLDLPSAARRVAPRSPPPPH